MQKRFVQEFGPRVFFYFDESMRNVFVFGIPQLYPVKLRQQIVDLEPFYLIVSFIAVNERFVALKGVVFCDDFGKLL